MTAESAMKALVASEERFRAVANSVPAIVWTAAPDGTITYANDQWFHYVGLTPQENATTWPELVLHPDDYDRCLAAWTRSLREGTEYQIEVRNRRYDGQFRWCLTRATPERDSTGRVVCWYGSTTDIHERKQAEEERDQLLSELQAAIRQRQEFISIAAHELKTPITILRGEAQLMIRRLDYGREVSPDRIAQAMRVIDQQSMKLQRLVTQLLDLSRIETGHLTLERAPVDLLALAQGVIEQANARIDHERVTLDGVSPLTVSVDALRIEQVLTNLIDNALKYSPADQLIEVGIAKKPGHAVLSVRDYGPGIPAEHHQHIFERFYQVHPDDQVKGFGLGLFVSRQIVDFHGGTIRIESPNGGGTRFVVELPLATQGVG